MYEVDTWLFNRACHLRRAGFRAWESYPFTAVIEPLPWVQYTQRAPLAEVAVVWASCSAKDGGGKLGRHARGAKARAQPQQKTPCFSLRRTITPSWALDPIALPGADDLSAHYDDAMQGHTWQMLPHWRKTCAYSTYIGAMNHDKLCRA